MKTKKVEKIVTFLSDNKQPTHIALKKRWGRHTLSVTHQNEKVSLKVNSLIKALKSDLKHDRISAYDADELVKRLVNFGIEESSKNRSTSHKIRSTIGNGLFRRDKELAQLNARILTKKASARFDNHKPWKLRYSYSPFEEGRFIAPSDHAKISHLHRKAEEHLKNVRICQSRIDARSSLTPPCAFEEALEMVDFAKHALLLTRQMNGLQASEIKNIERLINHSNSLFMRGPMLFGAGGIKSKPFALALDDDFHMFEFQKGKLVFTEFALNNYLLVKETIRDVQLIRNSLPHRLRELSEYLLQLEHKLQSVKDKKGDIEARRNQLQNDFDRIEKAFSSIAYIYIPKDTGTLGHRKKTLKQIQRGKESLKKIKHPESPFIMNAIFERKKAFLQHFQEERTDVLKMMKKAASLTSQDTDAFRRDEEVHFKKCMAAIETFK